MAVNHVSLFFGARATGSLVFSLISGVALENLSKSKVFMLSGCIPLLLFVYVWFVFEEKQVSQYSQEATAEEIREIVESHLKTIKPEFKIEKEKNVEKPIVFDENVKTRNFKFAVRPSENQENYNLSKKELEKENGFFGNIKSHFGFSASQPQSSQKTKTHKTKYDFGTFSKSKYEKTNYSVSDNFSMIYNQQRPNFLRDLKKILYVMKHPKIRRIIFLVSLVMITPSFGSTWNYYLTNVIKLQPEDMGELNFTASCGYLVGIIAMNTIFLGNLKIFMIY